jgi:PAS domain S-box-containing protein
MTDPSGARTYLNRRWYEFTGQTEAEGLGLGWLDATHPDDKARCKEVFAAAYAEHGAFRIEYRIRAADGSYRWTIDAAAPRFGEDGRFLGYVGSVIDITERKRAEETIRKREKSLRHLANTVPAFVWFADPDGSVHYLNDRWYEYTGQTPAEALPHGWANAIHPDDRARNAETWADARARGVLYEIEIRYRRRDGDYRWYLVRAEPMRDGARGRVLRWFGTCTDIDDQKLAEEHQELLIHELNHRVKNTLATVQSIAAQTLRNMQDPEHAKEAFENRLIALSRTHDVLTRENWEGASLSEIVSQAIEPYGSSGGANRLHMTGPAVRLSPRMALAIAMALQELATNAVKYGALSNATGEITIAWAVDDDAPASRLRLRWEETGGPPVLAPTRRGFGTRLIERSLAQDIDGTVRIEFAPTGLVCTADAPLEAS